jgi:hypothetical protein
MRPIRRVIRWLGLEPWPRPRPRPVHDGVVGLVRWSGLEPAIRSVLDWLAARLPQPKPLPYEGVNVVPPRQYERPEDQARYENLGGTPVRTLPGEFTREGL